MTFCITIIAVIMRPRMDSTAHLNNIGLTTHNPHDHSTPRTLADDILIISTGPKHRALFIKAGTDAHAYLQGMGAKVATENSLIFSSSPGTRKYFRSLHMGNNDGYIPIVLQCRGQGAFINTAKRVYVATLANYSKDANMLVNINHPLLSCH